LPVLLVVAEFGTGVVNWGIFIR